MNPKVDSFIVEELESRLLLSGNVEVAINGDDFLVTGDSAANDLRIFDK